MTKICFVSYEIHPTTAGGVGVLLYNSAHILLEQGHEIIFLLDIPEHEYLQFVNTDRMNLPHPEHCKAYLVSNLIKDDTKKHYQFNSDFEKKSWEFHLACAEIVKLEEPDIIEFFEFCGAGYHAISAKVCGLDYQETSLFVRLHNSLELIDQEQPSNIHSFERYIMFAMEHQSIRLAERVISPSKTFLTEAYLPNYEPWFGKTVDSKPALIERPSFSTKNKDANIILFYGRLFGFKGVDVFVEAAVLYLLDNSNPRRFFYLVGYDSNLPPDREGSYQDYLERKIPAKFKEYFVFTGRIVWRDLEGILPKVLFAAIPSYFESFCYAAHELYEAGVPLIVSNISAFKDYFIDGENAIVFDGSVGDLARKMALLSKNSTLQKKITRPYLVSDNPLGNIYLEKPKESWIAGTSDSSKTISLLVCIFSDLKPQVKEDNKLIEDQECNGQTTFFFTPTVDEKQDYTIWFLGKSYNVFDYRGHKVVVSDLVTKDAILIIRSSDVISNEYIDRSRMILSSQSQISYVGCWKKIIQQNSDIITNTLPFESMPEVLPFIGDSKLSRYVLRTEPDKLLTDLFDPRSGIYGELDYIWTLDNEQTSGIMIPMDLVQIIKEERAVEKGIIDYLILKDHNPYRAKRFARYLLAKYINCLEYKDPSAKQDCQQDKKDNHYSIIKSLKITKMLLKISWFKNFIKKIIKYN